MCLLALVTVDLFVRMRLGGGKKEEITGRKSTLRGNIQKYIIAETFSAFSLKRHLPHIRLFQTHKKHNVGGKSTKLSHANHHSRLVFTHIQLRRLAPLIQNAHWSFINQTIQSDYHTCSIYSQQLELNRPWWFKDRARLAWRVVRRQTSLALPLNYDGRSISRNWQPLLCRRLSNLPRKWSGIHRNHSHAQSVIK